MYRHSAALLPTPSLQHAGAGSQSPGEPGLAALLREGGPESIFHPETPNLLPEVPPLPKMKMIAAAAAAERGTTLSTPAGRHGALSCP